MRRIISQSILNFQKRNGKRNPFRSLKVPFTLRFMKENTFQYLYDMWSAVNGQSQVSSNRQQSNVNFT